MEVILWFVDDIVNSIIYVTLENNSVEVGIDIDDELLKLHIALDKRNNLLFEYEGISLPHNPNAYNHYESEIKNVMDVVSWHVMFKHRTLLNKLVK